MHDVFISYEKETKTIADNIVNSFERNGVRCWYAPRDVEGEYAQSIVNAIRKTKVFVVILNGKSSRSNHVLNEVESAYKEMEEHGLVILPLKVSNEVLSDAMTYYIKRFHWIDASNYDLTTAIQELLDKTLKILGIVKKPVNKKIERNSNKYFTHDDKSELMRLAYQRELVTKMADSTYNLVAKNYNKPVLLDIGSNDGFMTRDVSNKIDAGLTIGIEYDVESVEIANEKYSSSTVYFYQHDIEDESFETFMKSLLYEHNLEGVDILHISMVLLHLQNPFRVLKILRKYVRLGGTIIIRDIDDGYNLAYPDPNQLFDNAIKIISRIPNWGYRKSGRQIYTYLKKINCQEIKLEKLGIHTVNMTFSERDALYHTYFGAMLHDIELGLNEDQNNPQLKEDRDWVIMNKDEMEERFYQNSFFFSLGFVLFTAKIND